MSRNDQILRQWQILSRLNQRPYTRLELANEFEKSTKTIRRDIDALSGANGFPIIEEEDGNDRIYSFQTGYQLPGVWFTPEELAAITLGREILTDAFRGLPYQENFASLVEKMTLTQSSSARRAAQRLPEVFQSDFSPPQIHTEYKEDLIKAAQKQQCVWIRYFTAGRGTYSTRVIEPFVIRQSIQGLHLIAYCREKQDFRNFAINRIQALELQDEYFSLKERQFDLERYQEESFGGFRQAPAQDVRFFVKKPSSYWAKDLYYHPTQEIIECEDGIEIRFRAGGEAAIVRRAIGLGPDCTIIQPKKLQDQVIEMLEKIAKNYHASISLISKE